MTDAPKQTTSRRKFLHGTTSVALGAALASQAGFPAIVSARGQQTLKVGLIGCGGRGTGAALQALNADADVVLTAMGDLFEDMLQQSLDNLRRQAPDKVKVESNKCFLGFDAYRKVIDSGVDVVLLATPPGFRPLHLQAAVEAGKHAFVEIAAAVDAPGIRRFLASAELARNKNLAIVSGFCWRYSEPHRAACRQIQNGAIGDIKALYSTYYRGSLSQKYHGHRDPNWSDLQWQIRNWHNYRWLSGDVTILLSGGHSVDKMSWWLGDTMPTKAVAVGGRQLPAEGNIFDHAMVVYEYANGVRGFLGCRSQDGCYSENADYIIGSKGTCTIGRGRVPFIEGENPWRYQGAINNKYQTEHDELFASIRAATPINDGKRMAETSLMTLMGRMAAYTGQEITWEAALQSQESLVPDNLDWDTQWERPPVALPGITNFS